VQYHTLWMTRPTYYTARHLPTRHHSMHQHTTRYTLHAIHYTPYTTRRTLHAMHYTPYTTHHSPYTIHHPPTLPTPQVGAARPHGWE
jgi:hypothetical protein